jgi:hypothetical protein
MGVKLIQLSGITFGNEEVIFSDDRKKEPASPSSSGLLRMGTDRTIMITMVLRGYVRGLSAIFVLITPLLVALHDLICSKCGRQSSCQLRAKVIELVQKAILLVHICKSGGYI